MGVFCALRFGWGGIYVWLERFFIQGVGVGGLFFVFNFLGRLQIITGLKAL